ncbi:MAG: NADH-quinone oxidoreductase subunit G [Gammaproteobacteria bacterium]|nr:NADH-quinone oxidoreductase subunit G [Gammaproteobacteria bacterium]
MSATADTVRKETLVNIEIDGAALKVRRGDMVIEAADAAGVMIPRFCYHKKLSIAANCRMCLVEVDKVPKPLPACATPVTEGMKVFTRSPKALEAQQGTMEFLLINHPLDCPICDQGGECELQELSIGFGSDHSRFSERKRVVFDKDIGPLISTEMTRCIHCTRCVRFGEEIAGVREMGATGRGENTRIGTYIERALTSELAGNIIDLCPVGALTSKPFRFTARSWEMDTHATVAAHDCVGSNLNAKTRRHEVMRCDPRDNEAINECWISDRDRFSYTGAASTQRLTQPMVKQHGKWHETDWGTALRYAAEGLKKIVGAHGAEQLGVLISPNATVEEHYLAQKLTRALGSQNIDHRLRQQDFADQDAVALYPWLGQSLADLERQHAVLLVGSQINKDQPLLAHRLRKAALNQARIMVVNPVDFDFSFDISHKVITDLAGMEQTLAGIARAVYEHTGKPVPDGLGQLLKPLTISDEQRAIAQQLCGSGERSILLGQLAMMHPRSSTLRALAGAIAAASGATLGMLTDGANGAGAWLAGAVPHRLPAGQHAPVGGYDARAMLALPRRSYLNIGIEPEFDCGYPAQALAAQHQAEFVVALTAYRTATMNEYADVLLPVALSYETSGTLVNTEGRWQSFAATVKAPGESRPVWKVLRVLGNFLDQPGFDYASSEEVRDELKVTLGSSSAAGQLAWRCPNGLAGHDDGALVRVGTVPIYHADALLRRAAPLQQTVDGRGAEVACLNSREAARHGLGEAQQIVITEGERRAVMTLAIDDRIADGVIHIPLATAAAAELGGNGGVIHVVAD